ncbi:MAG: Fur family transcriptional regulator [Eubacteriales bacterium]|nr:Fur family transcriptional regulator [Eubacteriales bacterium]
MKPLYDKLTKELKRNNIRISYQRLKVLEYLVNHKCHPTVEQIYSSLNKDIPTLSKTTIYSTLNTLADAGMIRVINIEDHETRYDATIENHGHFKCESCGEIYDFNIDMDLLVTKDLKNFKILDKNVYFKGVCPDCMNKKNQ